MKKILYIALFFVLGCDSKKPNIELIQDMMDQPSYKAQDYDSTNPTGLAMRLPPEGTVPRGFKPYPLKPEEVDKAAKLVNPLAGQFSPEILAMGKERYDVFCAVCHGSQGRSDTPVADKMTVKRPPPLISETVRNYPDGRIYHIINRGQGIMGSYAGQIGTPEQRWAVVNYIRSLQKMTKDTK